MLVDSITIALVSYAISVSIAKAFAKKNGDELDVNQVHLCSLISFRFTFKNFMDIKFHGYS